MDLHRLSQIMFNQLKCKTEDLKSKNCNLSIEVKYLKLETHPFNSLQGARKH